MARNASTTADAPGRAALADLLRAQQRALTRRPYRQYASFGQWRIEQAMTGNEAGEPTYRPGDAVLVHGPSGAVVAVLGHAPTTTTTAATEEE